MNVWRPTLIVLGLLSFAGCGSYRLLGPLEIDVRPLDLTRTLPPIEHNYVAYFSDYRKLIDECGSGIENARKMYKRRVAGVIDRDQRGEIWRNTISSLLNEAMVECLERQPNLVPKECKHRMVATGGQVSRGSGGVGLQCGDSAILPLEVTIKPLDLINKTMSSKEEGTHVATYSNLGKLLDECGPGAKKARDITFQSDIAPDDIWDTFGRIVDNALVKCLEERNLIPEACRHQMITLHDSPVRSFEPKVHFRCGETTTDTRLH